MRLLLLFVLGSVIVGGSARSLARPRVVLVASTLVAAAFLSIRVVQ